MEVLLTSFKINIVNLKQDAGALRPVFYRSGRVVESSPRDTLCFSAYFLQAEKRRALRELSAAESKLSPGGSGRALQYQYSWVAMAGRGSRAAAHTHAAGEGWGSCP